MEDLKIGIHLPSCKDNKFNDRDFIQILKIKLEKFNPNFFTESNPSDLYYEFGYTQISATNLEKLERDEIVEILESTFRDLRITVKTSKKVKDRLE